MNKFKLGDVIILKERKYSPVPRKVVELTPGQYHLQILNGYNQVYPMDEDRVERCYEIYLEYDTPLYRILREMEEEDS